MVAIVFIIVLFSMGLVFPQFNHVVTTILEGLAPSQRSLENLSSGVLVIFAVGKEHFVLLFPAMITWAPVEVATVILKHGFALWVVAVDISAFNEALAAVTAKLMVNVKAPLAGLLPNPANRVVTENCGWVKGLSFRMRNPALSSACRGKALRFPTGSGFCVAG